MKLSRYLATTVALSLVATQSFTRDTAMLAKKLQTDVTTDTNPVEPISSNTKDELTKMFNALKKQDQCKKLSPQAQETAQEITNGISKALDTLAKDMQPSSLTALTDLFRTATAPVITALILRFNHDVIRNGNILNEFLETPAVTNLLDGVLPFTNSFFEEINSMINNSKHSKAFENFTQTVQQSIALIPQDKREQLFQEATEQGRSLSELMRNHKRYTQLSDEVKEVLSYITTGGQLLPQILGDDKPTMLLIGLLKIFEVRLTVSEPSRGSIKRETQAGLQKIQAAVQDALS